MNAQTLEQFLFWCMIINFGLMFISLALITLCTPLAISVHSRMFQVPEAYVRKAMHAFLSLYKLLLFFFIVVPWIVLKFILP